MNSLRLLVRRKAVEGIAKLAMRMAEVVESENIPYYVRRAAPDLVRVTSAPASRRAPWILPSMIMEKEKFVYPAYFPSKGELATYKGKKHVALESDDSPLFLTRAAPCLMLPPSDVDMVYRFYSLRGEGRILNLDNRGGYEEVNLLCNSDAKLVGSSHGWLATYTIYSRDLFLSNPLSGRRIKLPSPPPPSLPSGNLPLKVIISHSPGEEEEECRALMSFGNRRLAFCCPGRSKEWTPIGALYKDYHGMKLLRGYDDFVYSASRKLFFAVLQDETTVEAWDLSDPNSPSLISKETMMMEEEKWDINDGELTAKDWSRPVRYLVSLDNSDQLFLVTRHIMDSPDGCPIEDTKTIDFDVHRIDHQGKKLLCSLDGLAMFVGINHSFAVAVPASELTTGSYLKPDSIYFTHGKDGYDLGVFDYKNKTFTFHLPCSNLIRPPPLWFTPHLL